MASLSVTLYAASTGKPGRPITAATWAVLTTPASVARHVTASTE